MDGLDMNEYIDRHKQVMAFLPWVEVSEQEKHENPWLVKREQDGIVRYSRVKEGAPEVASSIKYAALEYGACESVRLALEEH